MFYIQKILNFDLGPGDFPEYPQFLKCQILGRVNKINNLFL